MTESYSQFTELMSYFYFNFNVYYALLTILALNALKTVMGFYRDPHCLKKHYGYDFLISILVGVGLLNALYFQGVLWDISSEEGGKLFGKMFVVCFTALMLFVLHAVFILKTYLQIAKEKVND